MIKMICNKRAMTTLSILMVLLLFGTTVHADQKRNLPRSYGPLYLGMSVKEFKKIFADINLGRCVHCTEEELQAVLTIDKDRAKFFRTSPVGLRSASIEYQPANLQPEMITCLFYKETLYSIELVDVKDTSKSVKERYIKALGEPTLIDVWNTGVSQLKWDRFSTSLKVLFSTKEKGVDIELVIIYIDLEILKTLPQEKRCGEDVEDSNKEEGKP